VELGVALDVRRGLGRHGLLGLRLSYATSSHRAGGEDYRLERPGVLAEGGVRFGPAPSLELYLLGGAGGAAVLRRGSGPTSGDPFAPMLSAGLGLQWSLGPRWALLAEGRALAQWIRVDGERTPHGGVLFDLGVAWAP
jgi:hypothetical protein